MPTLGSKLSVRFVAFERSAVGKNVPIALCCCESACSVIRLDPTSAPVGCSLVGEYVDEAELPANQPLHQGEAVRIRLLGLPPSEVARLRAAMPMFDMVWASHASFRADAQGVVDVSVQRPLTGTYAGQIVTLTVLHHGKNTHHIIEGVFKATARALREAVEPDPRSTGVPSTKGVL